LIKSQALYPVLVLHGFDKTAREGHYRTVGLFHPCSVGCVGVLFLRCW